MHHNITVDQNTFDISDVTLVNAKSVGGFHFTNNTVRRLDDKPYTSPPFVFTGCSDLKVTELPSVQGLTPTALRARLRPQHGPTRPRNLRDIARRLCRSWPMARLHDIVFDCHQPAATARFWAAALDGYAIAPYDDAELERLRSLGITSTEDDPTVLVEPAHGGPRLWFQRVPNPTAGKNRVHLDLLAADLDQEIQRLTALGATVQARHPGNTVLTDPEDNEFCLSPSA